MSSPLGLLHRCGGARPRLGPLRNLLGPRAARTPARRGATLARKGVAVAQEAPPEARLALIDWTAPFAQPAAAVVAAAAYAGVLAPDATPWLRALLCAAGPLALHVLGPALDLALGEKPPPALPPGARPPPADDLGSRLLPALGVAAHLGAALCCLVAVAAAPLQPVPLALLTYSLATSAAPTLAAAHELIHSRHPLHLAAARLHLTLHWWYPYYRAHHQHHLHACTPLDYASAPRGMDIYTYMAGYLGGSYTEAWQLACEECRRAGHPVVSIHNGALMSFIAQPLLTAAIGLAFGPLAAAVHLAASVIMLSYMSALDYALHYGLSRPPLPPPSPTSNAATTASTSATPSSTPISESASASPSATSRVDSAAGASSSTAAAPPGPHAPPPPQRYSPLTPLNSWTSLYPWENGVLYRVLIHADHHRVAFKSYAWLRPGPGAPLFPGPINLLALATFVPPLWMALMDERADQVNARNRQLLASGPGSAEGAGAWARGAEAEAAGPVAATREPGEAAWSEAMRGGGAT
ncbi:hypothetical protein HYH03_000415 [Edaphochlamys debaryana]|uniref:Alkane 1-monooxygenase n=1 Tax=Edaphochlamys debaryana TaxID=47281 RepID=A0A835YFF0_9CHLO|nr:hypothetical protein HYH03_000415 [Edaphochlamys debaryana]|eukprot:KAG2501917.1 hypothetical protein HYH03_000415 [Edaphochlamys debaryana]